MSETKSYVLIFDQEHLGLLGPFANDAEASKAGASWSDENGDNPCWQCVDLTDDQVNSPLPLST